jgi:hypothetical protein
MNRCMRAIGCIILAMIVACGCVNGPGEESGPATGAVTASLTPGPTQTLPSERSIDIQINDKDALDATISVIFAGGKGQVAVTSIEVRVTRSDGVVITENLPAEKGAELKIQGTKGDDRIEVFVSFNDGTSYKIIDRILPYRTRG